jgi:hypothetical protein
MSAFEPPAEQSDPAAAQQFAGGRPDEPPSEPSGARPNEQADEAGTEPLGGQPSDPVGPASAEQPGDQSPLVGAVRAQLDRLPDLELGEHPDVYERIHRDLQGALAAIDDA